MSTAQEDQALRKLPPQKYTIRLLRIAVVFLITVAIPAIWKVRTIEVDNKDAELRECQSSKIKMLEDHRKESQAFERSQLQQAQEERMKAQEERRRSDSILLMVTMAKRAVQKAIRDEKRK
jgi:hypothetical protein